MKYILILLHQAGVFNYQGVVGCVFWLERHCPSRICITWSDGKLTVVPGSSGALEGCCAQEEAWIVGKQDLEVAPRQCAGSRVAPHPQLSGKISDIRCAPSTLFSGLSPSRLFPFSYQERAGPDKYGRKFVHFTLFALLSNLYSFNQQMHTTVIKLTIIFLKH